MKEVKKKKNIKDIVINIAKYKISSWFQEDFPQLPIGIQEDIFVNLLCASCKNSMWKRKNKEHVFLCSGSSEEIMMMDKEHIKQPDFRCFCEVSHEYLFISFHLEKDQNEQTIFRISGIQECEGYVYFEDKDEDV